MILTTEAGDKYKLHFRHWHNPEFESKQRALHPPKKVWMGMSGKKDRAALNTTSCAIHLGECATKDRPCNTTGTEFGHAECSVLDTFDRAKGRGVAFRRAVQAFPKHVREALWKEWLKVYPPEAPAVKAKVKAA